MIFLAGLLLGLTLGSLAAVTFLGLARAAA